MTKSEFDTLKSVFGADFKVFNKGDILFYKWNENKVLCVDKENTDRNKRYRYLTCFQVEKEYDIAL